MSRACVHCGARMSRIADSCPSCGGKNAPQLPWYVYALGAVLVLAVFLWLADLPGLVAFIDRVVTTTP